MYLKCADGPRVVTLPDGRVLALSDLPPPDERHWTAGRKTRVVEAVLHGLLTPEKACRVYKLSPEEFDGWRRAYERAGQKGLRAKAARDGVREGVPRRRSRGRRPGKPA